MRSERASSRPNPGLSPPRRGFLPVGRLSRGRHIPRVTQRKPFHRPPSLLVANAFGTRVSQALTSLLTPPAYRVQFVSTGRALLESAPVLRPDIIVVDADLPDLDSVAVCRALRRDRAAWSIPVVVVTSTPATKQQRLAALQAGAWDSLSILMQPEELALKLDAMAHLKLDMERALQESAVDPASGLYTSRGLERRARELTAEAMRRHAPLACVALGVEPPPGGGGTAFIAQVLQAHGRTSDCVGRLGVGSFAVLAPATPPLGALTMARRLSQALEAVPPAKGALPLLVHAGYEAAADLRATPIEPAALIEHAELALRQARATSAGGRIRAYEA